MTHEKTPIDTVSVRPRSARMRPDRTPAAPRRCVAGALLAAPAFAFADALDSGDTAWMITATALVLLMTIPGLSLFYAGMVRSKNVLSVFMQCFAITGLMSILWAVYAYSLAFDEGNALVGGLGKAFLSGVTVDAMSGTIPETVFMTFQMTFAVITPALIVGAFAERMKFSAMLVFMALWLTLCYAPVCHWVWGGGWLGEYGILDFAGGTVVHINAGSRGSRRRWRSDRARGIPRRRCRRTTSRTRSSARPCCGSAGSGSTRGPSWPRTAWRGWRWR